MTRTVQRLRCVAGTALAIGSLTAFVFAIAVFPDNVPLSRPNNSTNQSTNFSVNGLVGGQSYFRDILCEGQVNTCASTTPSQFTQPTGQTTKTITVTFNTSGAGSGRIRLKVYNGASSDSGWYNVTVTVAYAVAVTPDGGTEPNRAANTGGYSAAFTVKNNGLNGNTYTLTCSGTGGVTCGTVPGPLTFPGNQPGSQQVVNMPYSVGAAGTGTLTLTATGSSGGVSDQGSFSVPIVSYGVSVTPDGQITPTRFSNTAGGYSETFTVSNSGSVSNTYTFSCAGGGGITCGAVPSAVTLGPSASTTVNQPYVTGAAGAGTLTLTAAGVGPSDQGSFSIPVALTLSTITNGALALDSRFLVRAIVGSYDAAGRVTQLTDARGAVSTYQYDTPPCHGAVTKITQVHDATGAIDLVTDVSCGTDGLVSSIKDVAGTFRYFTYDSYGRLRQMKNNAGVPVKAYGYTYSRASGNGWVYQATVPNAIVESTFVQQTPTLQVLVTTRYHDGLGRPIQKVVQDGANTHVSAVEYDLMGRRWRVWHPYPRAASGYDANFAATATAAVNSYFSVTNAKPFTETQYRPDPFDRPSKLVPEYIGASATVWATTSYDVDPTSKLEIVEITDESGKRSRRAVSIFGDTTESRLGYGAPEASMTSFAYDVLGRRTQATDPRGLITTYSMNSRSLLISRSTPDAGIVTFQYDRADSVRYTQDANRAAAGQVYFTNYDFAGRPLVSGLGSATFSSLDPDAQTQPALETTQANWLLVHAYDAKPSTTSFPWSRFATQIGAITLANVAGRLAAVASKSSGAWHVMLLSYDADGRIAKRYSYLEANDGATVLTSLNTNITYTRDLRDAITQRAETIGTNYFYQWYEYDSRGLLTRTFASTTNTKPGLPDLSSTYGSSGKTQQYQFQGNAAVLLRYTIRDQLERIGDPSVTTNPFAARYVYQPNGVIDTAEFYNGGSPAVQKRYRYAFGASAYDALNRMKGADFSSWTGTAWTSTSAYDLAGINYDASGNLLALQRYRETGTLVDNLTYTLPSTSNRLTSISDAISNSAETWDAESGTFSYDANGNMTAAPAPYSVTSATYDPANLPLSITRSGVTSTYRYDDAGLRITKQVGSSNVEVYVREGFTVLGVFAMNGNTVVSSYFNLVWEDRVAGRHASSNERTYYYFDLLGSVRAAVTPTGTITESSDFDPWGLAMPARNLTSPTPGKERFNGKERDAETGLDYFGVRFYMPALGRWTSVDPYAGLYPEWSSYTYALNNPVAVVDLNGDSINVSVIMHQDQQNQTNVLGSIISDLEQITGLSICVNSTGNLVYDTDEAGKADVAVDANGALVGSKTARDVLISGMNDQTTAYASAIPGMGSKTQGKDNLFNIDPVQVQSFVNGVQGGLNPMTQGYGMTFIHEFSHTNVGGKRSDPRGGRIGDVGKNEKRMNTIRRELGASYGQRTSYASAKINGSNYMPFDKGSLSAIQGGHVPNQGSMFIKF